MAKHPSNGESRYFARQIVVAFAALGGVAVTMLVFLMWIVRDVSDLVSDMRHDEHAIRQGLELTTAVRGTSLSIGACLISPTDACHARYERDRASLQSQLQQLAHDVPESERARVASIGERTHQMHTAFAEVALPAARRGDVGLVRQTHAEIERLAVDANAQADALARSLEGQMAHAHVMATDSTRLGLIGGALGLLGMLGLAVFFTARMRQRFLKPLQTLTEAARRIGSGEKSVRLGPTGTGELAELAAAFDQMSDEIQAREASLLQAERMAAIGQLAAGVAHELNNPIGIIRGYLKTMTPDADPATLGEELAILDEEAAQCQRITEDLLTFARTDVHRARVDLRDLCEQTIRRFRETADVPDDGVELVADAVEVDADAGRIKQVLMNLLHNANAAATGEVIRVEVFEDGPHAVLRVDDRGPGVPLEDRGRVFEPFYSKRQGGTGLGLAVVTGIAKAHGGTIAVLDAPPGGARFELRLPRRV